jgi:hypothetical protein
VHKKFLKCQRFDLSNNAFSSFIPMYVHTVNVAISHEKIFVLKIGDFDSKTKKIVTLVSKENAYFPQKMGGNRRKQ